MNEVIDDVFGPYNSTEARRIPQDTAETFELPPTGVDVEQLERSLVIQALKRAGGNQTKAAALLGLSRDQIRYRIEKFGLTISH